MDGKASPWQIGVPKQQVSGSAMGRPFRFLVFSMGCTALAACGPTMVSSEILSSIADPPARVELRVVQPDFMDDWTTHEMWAVNLSDEPVCAGVRDEGMSWFSYLVPPRSEKRLVGLGNGAISGQTNIMSLRGRECTDGLVAGQ